MTGGDGAYVVECLREIAAPLGLTAEKIWGAVDELFAEGLLVAARQSGTHVRLTAAGVGRCVEYQRHSVD